MAGFALPKRQPQPSTAMGPAPEPGFGSAYGPPPNAQHGANAPFAGTTYNYQGWGPGARQSHQTQNAAAAAASAAQSPYGSQSGPGILENWFNQRANGADPGYEYAMQRGGDSIDARMAAGGSYNSGARGQQLSDFAANMGAQREGQLDALAGGASGEHQGRVNSMFAQGQALAGGQAGLASAYDLGAAGNMSAANNAMNAMNLNSAAQQQQAHQGFANNLMSIYGAYKAGNSGSGGSTDTNDYGKV